MRTLAFFSLLLLPATVSADDAKMVKGEAAAVAKYRHNAYEGMGKHMKVLGMMAKGEVSLPQADQVAHAKALQSTASLMAGWFPAGTGPAAGIDTDALQAVWKDAPGFEKAIANYKEATDTLVAKAEAGNRDEFLAAFKAVGKTCGGCHDSFRKDDH